MLKISCAVGSFKLLCNDDLYGQCLLRDVSSHYLLHNILANTDNANTQYLPPMVQVKTANVLVKAITKRVQQLIQQRYSATVRRF